MRPVEHLVRRAFFFFFSTERDMWSTCNGCARLPLSSVRCEGLEIKLYDGLVLTPACHCGEEVRPVVGWGGGGKAEISPLS